MDLMTLASKEHLGWLKGTRGCYFHWHRRVRHLEETGLFQVWREFRGRGLIVRMFVGVHDDPRINSENRVEQGLVYVAPRGDC